MKGWRPMLLLVLLVLLAVPMPTMAAGVCFAWVFSMALPPALSSRPAVSGKDERWISGS